MPTITLNGETRKLPEGTTVATLLQELDLDRPGIAVAIDRRVVPRSRHPEVRVDEGQVVEVIRAVGGG